MRQSGIVWLTLPARPPLRFAALNGPVGPAPLPSVSSARRRAIALTGRAGLGNDHCRFLEWRERTIDFLAENALHFRRLKRLGILQKAFETRLFLRSCNVPDQAVATARFH
jgi:hypothetical protein